MTNLPFIALSYALGVLVPVGFALDAWIRVARAKRRLAAAEPRRTATR